MFPTRARTIWWSSRCETALLKAFYGAEEIALWIMPQRSSFIKQEQFSLSKDFLKNVLFPKREGMTGKEGEASLDGLGNKPPFWLPKSWAGVLNDIISLLFMTLVNSHLATEKWQEPSISKCFYPLQNGAMLGATSSPSFTSCEWGSSRWRVRSRRSPGWGRSGLRFSTISRKTRSRWGILPSVCGLRGGTPRRSGARRICHWCVQAQRSQEPDTWAQGKKKYT